MNNPSSTPPSSGNSTWGQVLGAAAVALIGFGFAVYRYIQFSGADAGIRLSRLERPIYRAAGKWGLVIVFLVMGIWGAYAAIKHFRQLKK
ncbi:MAG TPA: hypothetical protein VFS25_14305 [Chitinophaga sp.]|uniref:hypothetical protein n=1 Tax=Chitinophaga sp. TaxID=1869181 RepID=UPI002DC03AB4|nr:hypothetical protein [Chitinophaga sp.]HEU4554011.1 hypothetical protein [Chitinophaga sp.]